MHLSKHSKSAPRPLHAKYSQRSPMVATPQQPDAFVNRHIGPREGDVAEMLGLLGASSVDELIDQTVPPDIRLNRPLDCPQAVSEHELLGEMELIAAKNQLYR